MAGRWAIAVATSCVVALASGCVSPATTVDAYEAKAALTAEAAASAARTALLVRIGSGGST